MRNPKWTEDEVVLALAGISARIIEKRPETPVIIELLLDPYRLH